MLTRRLAGWMALGAATIVVMIWVWTMLPTDAPSTAGPATGNGESVHETDRAAAASPPGQPATPTPVAPAVPATRTRSGVTATPTDAVDIAATAGPHDALHAHDEPPADVVAGRGPDTPLEQLAVDRLLADATGIGRTLWPDLDSQPCCLGTTITIDGVTTLVDADTTAIVIAWTAGGVARTTTSRWHQADTDVWEPTP